MKNRSITCVLVFLCSLLSTAARAADENGFIGDWKGTLDAGARKIPFIFHVGHDGKGALAGCLDSPSEKLTSLDVSSITVSGDSIELKLDVVGAVYAARLAPDGKSLAGKWRQRGAEIELNCTAAPQEMAKRVKGQERLVGTYEGKLEVQGTKLTVAFHIREDVIGRLSATFDSIDQNAKGVPVGEVEFDEDGDLVLRMPNLGAAYDGTFEADRRRIDGKWKQGSQSFPLELLAVEKASTLKRPQTPKPPFPYRAIDVSYENPAAKLTLAGTLTTPDSKGPFPAVLLITGSGSQDRDETIFEHRPFFVIADALTRRGVAVLRVDDRGVGKSTGSPLTATSLDLAGDVEAGVEFLKKRPEIDAARIGLVGHSEGGIIAPMLASKRQDIAFVVMLAGPGLNGEKILYAQSALLMKAQGASDEDVAANRKIQEQMFAVLKDSSLDSAAVIAKLRSILSPTGTADPSVDAQIASVNSPWMRYFIAYEPLPALEQMRCPVLALFGEKDLQVPAVENAKAMDEVVKKRGDGSFVTKIVPGVNHLFQKCSTGGIDEYAKIEQTMDEGALAMLVDYVVSQAKPAAK